MMNINDINLIYKHLGDDLSKKIFAYRIMNSYSNNNDPIWIERLMRTNRSVNEMISKLVSEPAVIFGAGQLAREFIFSTPSIKWKYIVDNYPKAEKYLNVQIVSFDYFMRHYNEETILIATTQYNDEIYNQLMQYNVDKRNILSYRQLLDQCEHIQYLDLPMMHYSADEVFIDVGCLDGMTDVYLKQRIGDKVNQIVAFEPDKTKNEIIANHLRSNNINYKIVNKAAWSSDTTLQFGRMAKGCQMSVMLDSEIESVETTTIDETLKQMNINATFIKMDIEGSEAEALKGAKTTISTSKPKLAISVYHKPEDIFDIPSIILKYNPEYTLYLRHYSPRSAETVLYAIQH